MTIDGISKMTYTYNTERGKVHSNLLTGNRVGLDRDMHIPSAGILFIHRPMVQPSPKEDRCSGGNQRLNEEATNKYSNTPIVANSSHEIG